MTCSRLAVALLLLTTPLQAAAPRLPRRLTFEQHIRPILRTRCLECHGESGKPKGGIDLRLRRLIVGGGRHGPAIVPGKAGASLLFQRVRDHEMPPGKVKLAPAEIATIAAWINGGAITARPEPEKLSPGLHIGDEERNFWSFRPIQRPAIPQVRSKALVRSPLDAFVLHKLEAAGLTFAPEADRINLLRRATFDLIGLPPTPEEVEAFVADRSPNAWAKVVDRLLASPAYGERWGRHWLDVAGYADSHGYSGADPVRRYAWKYRDYVIRAFNSDKPFDDFIIEQLAGDELVNQPAANLSPDDLDKLIATGFLRTAPDGTASGADRKAASNQTVADTLQIVSTALLGMTLQCAQCHTHRYDPIPQEDYYRLRAVFEPAYDVSNWRTPQGRLLSLMRQADRQKAAAIEKSAAKIDAEREKKQAEYIESTLRKQLAKVPAEVRSAVEKAQRTPRAKRSKEQKELLRKHPSVNVTAGSLYLYDSKAAADLKAYADRAVKLRAAKPVEDFIDALTEVPGRIPKTLLFHRGDPEQPRQAVEPGGLMVLAGLGLGAIPNKDSSRPTTGRRLAFAKQLVSGKHPLTARVLVNRVWMHHFGKGIVATPGDFGVLGERPTHPELLDYLAAEFMRDWSLKRLHRLILSSRVYRQSSKENEQGRKIDPDGKLLWRMPLRRLEAEAVRDSLLAVSGRLERRLFGSPVPVMPDGTGQIVLGVDLRDGAGYINGQPVLLGNDLYRRSIYVQVRRSMPLAVLETFDAPGTSPNCERRTFSTVAPQALLLMNSEFMVETATRFARRIRQEAGSEPNAQVERAWRLAYGRSPTAGQLAAAVDYLAEQSAHYAAAKKKKGAPTPRQQALATFCQALLSSNRFLYVE
jgi:mono/diheme cytochrome c family protein